MKSKTQKPKLTTAMQRLEEKKRQEIADFEQFFVKTVAQYMPVSQWMATTATKLLKCEKLDDKLHYCLDNVKRISDYRLKVAKGKPVKNDLKHKQIVDLSTQLETYTNQSIECGHNKRGTRSKTDITIKMDFTGRICLPFDKCVIHTQITNVVSQIVEITHDLKGVYTGNVFVFLPDCHLIQMSLEIKKEGDKWGLTFVMPFQQKPLGNIFSNIDSLLAYLGALGKPLKDRYDEVCPNAPIVEMLLADICTGVLAVFNMLDSYKSKYMYEATKDGKTVYVCTHKKDVTGFMDTHYKGFDYKLLDGWLNTGYWKILGSKEMGKTKDGKSIRGLDWLDPYKQGDSIMIQHHAIQRAKERYNMDLTILDLDNILELCFKTGIKLTIKTKLGRLLTPKGKTGPYRITYNGKVLDVVVDKSPADKTYRIATVLPKPKDTVSRTIECKDYKQIMKDAGKKEDW